MAAAREGRRERESKRGKGRLIQRMSDNDTQGATVGREKQAESVMKSRGECVIARRAESVIEREAEGVTEVQSDGRRSTE